jgi:hypothetical protein
MLILAISRRLRPRASRLLVAGDCRADPALDPYSHSAPLPGRSRPVPLYVTGVDLTVHSRRR